MTVLLGKMVSKYAMRNAHIERGCYSLTHSLCVIIAGVIMNDETVHQLCKQAVSQVIVGKSSHPIPSAIDCYSLI